MINSHKYQISWLSYAICKICIDDETPLGCKKRAKDMVMMTLGTLHHAHGTNDFYFEILFVVHVSGSHKMCMYSLQYLLLILRLLNNMTRLIS
jgi:hypothetical protein